MPMTWRVHVLAEKLRQAGVDAEVVERDILTLDSTEREAVLDAVVGENADPPMVLVNGRVACAGEIDVAAVIAAARGEGG